MRPSMQLRAVSTPAAIWLWELPEPMLPMNVRSLSRSANSRLSLKAPLAANFPEPVAVYRGPYEYSVPGHPVDFIPQSDPQGPRTDAGAHGH